MTEVIQGLAEEAKRNKYSTIAPSVSESDVLSIWDLIASYIVKQLYLQKGVLIPGLGTFTLSQKKIDLGRSECILAQRPVFVISKKLAQTHQLSFSKHNPSGIFPVVPLNFSSISIASTYSRDTVETCVKEVICAVSHAISAQKNVELCLTGVGRLIIRNSKVKMKFYKEIVQGMDATGTVIKAMSDRPNTADSVMSEQPQRRLHTGSTVILPRLPSRQLEAVKEEPEEEDSENPNVLSVETEHQLDAASNIEASGATPQRQTMSVARASICSFTDDIIIPATPAGLIDPRRLEAATPLMQRKIPHALDYVNYNAESDNGKDQAKAGNSYSKETETAFQERELSSPKPPTRPSTTGSCGHINSGQELCYVCHQRDIRNVPVSYAEEKRKREEQEDFMLRQYLNMKDSEAIQKEANANVNRRMQLEKNSAFNHGVADAIRLKRTAKDPTSYSSFLFRKRPLTPPKRIKQDKLDKDLHEQVSHKQQCEEKEKNDAMFLERLQQAQMAECVELQQKQELLEKEGLRENLKRALSAQIRFKPAELPAREPDSDSPIFGKNDMTNEKLALKHQRAREVLQDQLEAASQRKREELLRKLEEQKHEEKVIAAAKQELLHDRANRFKNQYRTRKEIENDWMKATHRKMKGELEDKLRSVSPGILVHEQCDRYRRCRQCKRKMSNFGSSNIWCDTRYIPGTRLIV